MGLRPKPYLKTRDNHQLLRVYLTLGCPSIDVYGTPITCLTLPHAHWPKVVAVAHAKPQHSHAILDSPHIRNLNTRVPLTTNTKIRPSLPFPTLLVVHGRDLPRPHQ